jgi:hypothetical protein
MIARAWKRSDGLFDGGHVHQAAAAVEGGQDGLGRVPAAQL